MEDEVMDEVVYNSEEVMTEVEALQQVHNDLGLITCFLVFFTLVILLKYIYKFFNMIFQF